MKYLVRPTHQRGQSARAPVKALGRSLEGQDQCWSEALDWQQVMV